MGEFGGSSKEEKGKTKALDVLLGAAVIVGLAWLGKKMDNGFWKIVRERRKIYHK